MSVSTKHKERKLAVCIWNNCYSKTLKISGQNIKNFKNDRKKYTKIALSLGVGKGFFKTTTKFTNH